MLSRGLVFPKIVAGPPSIISCNADAMFGHGAIAILLTRCLFSPTTAFTCKTLCELLLAGDVSGYIVGRGVVRVRRSYDLCSKVEPVEMV